MFNSSFCIRSSSRTIVNFRYNNRVHYITVIIYAILYIFLFLDEYWGLHPELHDIPIYYASSLAKKCMAVYQTYINAMNDRIKRQIAVNNPFVFKHITNLKVC